MAGALASVAPAPWLAYLCRAGLAGISFSVYFPHVFLMALQFDLVVIGSGPGGYVAAIRAAQLGLKVGVVERESLGGICLNWGCIPTKALLKTAQVYEYLQHAQDYGLTVQGAGFDFNAVIKRSRGVADGMSKGINFLFKKNKIEVVNGTGKLLAPGKVEVTKADGTKETVEAKSIILATGARARQLPNLPIDDKKIIGYRKAMTPDSMPKRMVVVGSGAIGVEFAYFYRSLGAEVTIVEYLPRIVPVEDEEVSRQMEKSYKKMGINILTNAEVTKVDTSGVGCNVFIKTQKGEEQIACDVVLSAVGVQTNIENIGLEELGIKTERGRVLVDDFYQTNVPGIYAIGDIIPGPALAHVASAEGIICVEKITGHNPEPLNYTNIPGCTYAQPEIASVGYTEAEAKAKGYEVKVGKFPFSASGKAAAGGVKDGFVKVIFDAKYGEWLGAHMIGANVTEMIAEVVVARKLETTGHEIIKSVHPHPTMSEAIMEAAAAAYDEVIHL
jgi:dihydrolipoamide dehydrogenase